ncbi:amidohydrolase 2 [Mycena amicta]|nr:amidohydrolase 2 [Mycena amicta]
MIASFLFAVFFAILQGPMAASGTTPAKALSPAIAFEEAWTTPALIQLTLRAMDAAGVDFVVLSCANPCTQGIADQATAEEAARTFNNELAAVISNNTLRFAGFAALAMHDPSVAALELRRAVSELGFLGALLNDYQVSGPNNGFSVLTDLTDTLLFYDQPAYDVFWEAVRSNIKEIQTPLYGHATWLESASQVRFPSLQILVGHLGERIPSDIWRIDNALAGVIGGATTFPPMKQTIAYYLRHNILQTTSGNFATSLLKFQASQIGFERILYSVDYPWVAYELGEAWLEELAGVLDPKELLALKRGRSIEVLHLER